MKKTKIPLRAFVFVIIFVLIFSALNWVFTDVDRVFTTWKPLQDKNTEADIVIMGNSHAYTSLDSLVLSEALGRRVYILGSSGQSIDIALENLKTMLAHTTPKVVVLETCCVSFGLSSREQLRTEAKSSVWANMDGINGLYRKFLAGRASLDAEDVVAGMFPTLRAGFMWSRWKNNRISSDSQPHDVLGYAYRQNAKYIDGTQAQYEEFLSDHRKCLQETEIREIDEQSEQLLREFFSLCREKGIEVWLYVSPTIHLEPLNIKKINAIGKIAADYGIVFYDNMEEHIEDIGLTLADYYDNGHLNRRGAHKVTEYYGKIIADRLGIEINFDNAFFYRSESLEPLGDGKNLFTLETYGKALYKFTQSYDGRLIEDSGWTENNSVITSLDLNDKKSDLTIEIRPVDDPNGQTYVFQAMTKSAAEPNP